MGPVKELSRSTAFMPARWKLVAASMAGVSLLAAALYLGRPRVEVEAPNGFGSVVLHPPISRPGSPPSMPERPQSRLPSSNVLHREDEALEAIFAALAGESTHSGAKARAEEFTRELAKEPKIQKAYQEYLDQPSEQRPSPKQFLGTLKHTPEFRRVAARFASGGMSGALSPSARLGASGALSGLPSAATARSFEGAKGVDRQRVAQEWARKGASGVELPAGRVRGEGGPRPGIAAEASLGAGVVAGGNGGGYRREPPQPLGSFAGSAAADKPHQQSGPEPHAVDKDLKKIAPAGPGRNAVAWYITELLELLPAGARRSIEALLGREDLWGACFMTNQYDLCRQTCARLKRTRCTDVPPRAFDACQSGATRSQVACVMLCLDEPARGCSVPADIHASLCKRQAVGRGYCFGNQEWGPPKLVSSDPEVYEPVYGSRGGAIAAAPRRAGAQPIHDVSWGGTDGRTSCMGKYQGTQLISGDPRPQCAAGPGPGVNPGSARPLWFNFGTQEKPIWDILNPGKPIPARSCSALATQEAQTECSLQQIRDAMKWADSLRGK